jgi:hypothetical protein
VLKEVIAKMKQKLSDPHFVCLLCVSHFLFQTYKLMMYSAHDTTIASTLEAMNTDHWECVDKRLPTPHCLSATAPPYASALFFNMYQKEGKAFVEVVYKNRSELTEWEDDGQVHTSSLLHRQRQSSSLCLAVRLCVRWISLREFFMPTCLMIAMLSVWSRRRTTHGSSSAFTVCLCFSGSLLALMLYVSLACAIVVIAVWWCWCGVRLTVQLLVMKYRTKTSHSKPKIAFRRANSSGGFELDDDEEEGSLRFSR